MVDMTLYSVLGVSTTASQDEIKRAYRKKSRFLHPDVTQSDDSTELFQMIQNAYDVLSNEERRKEYDNELNKKNEPEPEPYEEPSWGDEEVWDETPPEEEPLVEDIIEEDIIEEEPLDNEDDTIRPSPLHPTDLTWTDNVPVEEVKYVPSINYKRPLHAAYIALGITGIFAAILFSAFFFTESPQGSTLAIGICTLALMLPAAGKMIPLPYALKRSAITTLVSRVSLILAAASALFFVFLGLAAPGLAKQNSVPMLASAGVYLLVTAAAITSYVLMIVSQRRRIGSNTTISAALSEMNIFGKAGDLEDAISKFGEENVRKGILGEKQTAKLLSMIPTYIPSAKVFHGLKFPTETGKSPADVDHAVLVGKRLALIDSKYWKEAHYEWDEYGDIAESYQDGYIRYRNTHFPAAVERYAAKFPHLEVFGWILIHPANGNHEKLTFSNKHASNVYLSDASTAMETIGSWLLDGEEPYLVNRRYIMQMFANMK